jgi:hypothetical protein
MEVAFRMRQVRLRTAGAPFVLAAVAAACVAVTSWPVAAGAAGALAIGQPADVAGQGFAYGLTANLNAGQASEKALDQCRNAKGAKEPARAACRVVGMLNRQCAAVAMDPASGTPGVGWAVANDKKTAETQALTQCRETAGAGREAFCKVSVSACDSKGIPQGQ